MTTYKNLDGSDPRKGIGEFLKWQLTKPRRKETFTTPRRNNDGAELRASTDASLTWIGHATFVQRLGGKVVATDPIWSKRIHTIPRLCPPGVEIEACSKIDVVTVSHSHYDHMDVPTLKRIGPEAVYVVPRDNGEVLRSAGLPNVVELDWWESHRVGDLKVTLVPAQHWSMRAPWDRNKRLWGGFVFEGPEGVAMHWGTFVLTDEPLGEPTERIRAWFRERRLGESRLWVMDVGETRQLTTAK